MRKMADIVECAETVNDLKFLARVVGLTIRRVGRRLFTLTWDNGRICVANVQWDVVVAVLDSIYRSQN